MTESSKDDPTRRSRLWDFIFARRIEPLLPDPEPATAQLELGICCSGGGIRSAAYCLGALQELDDAGELEKASILAAVSGGSYTAAAHTILRSKSEPSLLPPPYGDGSNEERPFAPGSPEEEHLRNRTSYLVPGVGGIWYFAWRMLRGLLLNVLVITSFLYVVSFALGVALIRPFLLNAANGCPIPRECRFSPPRWSIGFILVALAVALLLGAIDLILRPSEGVARALEAWSVRALNFAIASATVLLLVPFVLRWIAVRRGDILIFDTVTQTLVSLASAWSAGLLAIAALLGFSGLGFGRKGQPAERSSVQASAVATIDIPPGVRARIQSALLRFAAALLGPVLAFGAVVSFAFVGTFRSDAAPPQLVLVFAVAVLAVTSLWGDLTRWSLHPAYKRRLSSAFFLKRTRVNGEVLATEVPYQERVKFSELAEQGPELVVCAAANVSDYGAAPRGRRSVPFNFSTSQLYGGRLLGRIQMSAYEKAARQAFDRDITVPAAVAMSGAALSPSMGRHSRWWATFLLAVANVRLGVWLPNPRAVRREQEGGRRLRKRAGIWYLFRELAGANSYRSDYVYVTDGGHYENLGLIELLRRGCRNIYCFDASGDAIDTFNTLGEAIALAQSELNVEIEIDLRAMAPHEGSQFVARDHAVGAIWFDSDRRKPQGERRPSGRLVVAKAGVGRDAPSDVLAYLDKDPQFPNHGTADQLYTVERFDAYRRLGAHAARKAMQSMRTGRPVDARVVRPGLVLELDREDGLGHEGLGIHLRLIGAESPGWLISLLRALSEERVALDADVVNVSGSDESLPASADRRKRSPDHEVSS